MIFLSLGACVQSSVLALMAARGDLPAPDCAIFADTQWEPPDVYEHLDWLESELPYPVHRVSAGNLRSDLLAGVNSTGQPHIGIPVRLADGGMAQRQCTKQYKIVPITRHMREEMGLKPRQRVKEKVEQWLGISTNEIARAKPAAERWIERRYPLIELGMSRIDCRQWFEERYPGRTLPRSACIGCPYRGDAEWAGLDEESWQDAVFVDDALRRPPLSETKRKGGGMYLHRSLVPLSRANIVGGSDQASFDWDEECEGVCGV